MRFTSFSKDLCYLFSFQAFWLWHLWTRSPHLSQARVGGSWLCKGFLSCLKGCSKQSHGYQDFVVKSNLSLSVHQDVSPWALNLLVHFRLLREDSSTSGLCGPFAFPRGPFTFLALHFWKWRHWRVLEGMERGLKGPSQTLDFTDLKNPRTYCFKPFNSLWGGPTGGISLL